MLLPCVVKETLRKMQRDKPQCSKGNEISGFLKSDEISFTARYFIYEHYHKVQCVHILQRHFRNKKPLFKLCPRSIKHAARYPQTFFLCEELNICFQTRHLSVKRTITHQHHFSVLCLVRQKRRERENNDNCIIIIIKR